MGGRGLSTRVIWYAKNDRLDRVIMSEGKLRVALRMAIKVMEIAGDWHAPRNYDIELPFGWADTLDPESDKPTWPTLYGIIRKCKEALNE